MTPWEPGELGYYSTFHSPNTVEGSEFWDKAIGTRTVLDSWWQRWSQEKLDEYKRKHP